MAATLPAAAQTRSHEIVVTIKHVRALDRTDWAIAGQPDFSAVVTIAGTQCRTRKMQGQSEVTPTDWVCRQTVTPGRHDVKLELVDRDVFKPDDLIDINGRRDMSKRHQDFVVDTRGCAIYNLSGASAGYDIVKSGDERKRAQITFTVNCVR